MTIKIARILDLYDIPFPSRKHSNDAGIDLYYSGDNFNLSPNKIIILETNIKVKIPKGYFGFVADKSRNMFDIIGRIVDESYQGEILIKVVNNTAESIGFKRGQPVAQLILIPCLMEPVEEVLESNLFEEESERGSTGGIVSQLAYENDTN
jgi:dUTP pyrophosphatase